MAIDWVTMLTSPKGRIRRKPYWAGLGVLLAPYLIVQFIPVIGGLLLFVLLFPVCFVVIKRLHDLGRSGWWCLVLLGARIPTILANVAMLSAGAYLPYDGAAPTERSSEVLSTAPGVLALYLLSTVLTLVFLVMLGSLKGQQHRNRFGRAPGMKDVADAFE